MSVNAFYNAFNATQNALGDPRGDAEKRRRQEVQDAMAKTQFDQQQAAYRAKMAEEARMRAEAQDLFNIRAERGFHQPNPSATTASPPIALAPQGGMTPAPQAMAVQSQPEPMQGGAPLTGPMTQAPASNIDPISGKTFEQVQVDGVRKVPMMSQEDEGVALLRAAYKRNDPISFNSNYDKVRARMTEQEKLGRQQIASIAGQILQYPAAQRHAAVVQMLDRLGVDPETVKIDDYANDPQGLENALRFEMMMGAPEDGLKAGINVDEYNRKQQAEQKYGPVQEIDIGDEIVLVDGSGKVVDRYRKGISAETRFKEDAATSRNNNDNATSAANSRRTANRPIFDDGMFGDTEGQGQVGQPGPWDAYRGPQR